MTLPPLPIIAIRLGIIIAAIAAWFLTQALLAKRVPTSAATTPLTDGIHTLTARWHARLFANARSANALLISSSLVIDLLGAYLILASLLGPTFRPFLGLVMVFALRQLCQMLCPLPNPEGMIWRHPGFPALLVTYGTTNDLFFSGHTAIAIFGAAILATTFGPLGIALGLAIALFEIITVLVLRAHYTMDVFTGIICAMWVFSISSPTAHWFDAVLRGI